MKSIENLRQPERAATILAHPLRARILASAKTPISASDIARSLGQPRQRVNYHVRQLAAAGLLTAGPRQRKRNMTEQQYQASAGSYVLTNELLGEVAVSGGLTDDPASVARLVGVCTDAQTETTGLMEVANAAGVRVRTLSLQHELQFELGQDRIDFSNALNAALAELIEEYALPDNVRSNKGRAFRLLLAFYPLSTGTPQSSEK